MRYMDAISALLGAVIFMIAAGTASAAETGTVSHLMGRTDVPIAPQRIATLQDHTLLLPLLELGVRPVASAGRFTRQGEPHFRGTGAYDTSDIGFLGLFSEPDLEALVAARPDLIIGAAVHQSLYPLLSAIAPTVILPTYDVPVTEHMDMLAGLVGATSRHASLRAEYDRRIAALRDAIGDPSRVSVMHIQVQEGGFWVPARSPIDDVINDVGFARPEAWTAMDGDDLTLGIEALPRFDADVLIDTYEPLYGTREATRHIRDTALWQNLFAVRNDQFIYAERSRWMALSYASLFDILAGLEAHLADRTIATRTP